MVLSVQRMLALTLCVSTLTASEIAQTSALRMYPRRNLVGIHHTTKYAPEVVKQESHDSYDSIDSGSKELELKVDEELELHSSKDIDVELDDGSVDVNVDLQANEMLDFSGDGDQDVDIMASEDLDVSADVKLEGNEQMDTELELKDGTVGLELAEDEDYTQDLEIQDDEELDQTFDVPEGARSIRLRVRKGHVDLDVVKAAPTHVKEPEAEKEQVSQVKEQAPEKEPEKTEVVAMASTEKAVSYAAEAKDWFKENGSKPIFLGGIIGAAVGLVGVAGVAIAKGRKRTPEKSVLAEDVIADADAKAEADEDAEAESDSDEDSDEDVEAGVTALTEEGDAVAEAKETSVVEEKKTSVVEGSV